MKQILYFMLVLLAIGCEKEPYERFENDYNTADIVKIDLSASSSHLFNNGVAELEFFIEAYYEEEISRKIYMGGKMKDTTYIDTIKFEQRNLPEGIKILTSEGEEVEDFRYATTESISKLTFYAESNDVNSDLIEVIVDVEPEEELKEYVIPIVFHMVVTDDYELQFDPFTEEKINKLIDNLNKVLANEVKTNAPHSMDLKVRFELAETDPNGNAFEEQGINRVFLGDQTEDEAMEYINNNLIWDHNKYLNIWVCSWSPWSQYDDPKASAPTHITTDPALLPGLTMEEVDENAVIDIVSYEQVGIAFTPSHFIDNTIVTFGIGKFLGLFETIYYEGYGAPVMVEGDMDYCSDTFSWNRGPLDIWKTTVDSKLMKSVNIMDEYSIGSVISFQQGLRIRNILEYCPLRKYN